MYKSILKYLIFFASSAILIILDQMTKHLATIHLKNSKPISIIEDVIELTYVENRGAAFGILQDKHILFYSLTIVVLIVICTLLYKTDDVKTNISYFVFLILIFSGAIGNFIDRIKNKYVVDFIYFKPIDFPVFNFADIYITIACIFMLFYLFLFDKDKVK